MVDCYTCQATQNICTEHAQISEHFYLLCFIKFSIGVLRNALFSVSVQVTSGFVQIQFTDCIITSYSSIDISVGNISTILENTALSATLLQYEVERTYFERSYTNIQVHNHFSFMMIRMINNIFNGSIVNKFSLGDFVGAVFENCTFIRNLYTMNGIYFAEIVYLFVSDCRINIHNQNCLYGCAIWAIGSSLIYKDVPEFTDLAQILVCPVESCNFTKPVVLIENTVFGGIILTGGNGIFCKDVSLIIHNSTFNYLNISREGRFIHYTSLQDNLIKVRNVIFNASAINRETAVVGLAADGRMEMENVEILCPKSFSVHLTAQRYSKVFLCKYGCPENHYTFEAGELKLSGEINEWNASTYHSIIGMQKKCVPCPVGANCENKIIKALPNYWGYKNKSDFVTMLRCPEGYCCEGNETCKGIDSCNTGRTGTLCGTCKNNSAESLFSTRCIHLKHCSGTLVIVLYSTCAGLYSLVLLIVNSLKDKAIDKVTEIYKVLKKRIFHKKKSTSSEKELEQGKESKCQSKDTEDKRKRKLFKLQPTKKPQPNKDKKDNSMKYIQILFYYVQDASLFKVHLPEQGQQSDEIIVKILQFSPEIIVTLYAKISDMCFSHGTNAVAKVLFKSLYGPYVMFFLFTMYIIQKVFSRVLFPKSPVWKSLRTGLVQAFLVAFLFSYQQIVTGIFSLVQCVQINQQKVLYVQGNIECYTWWQVLAQIYIYLCIIPICLVLSYVPFLLQDRTMSVKTFLLACLLPIPSLAYFLCKNVLQKLKILRNRIKVEANTGIEIRTSELSDDESLSREFTIEPYTGPDTQEIPYIDDSSVQENSYISGSTDVHSHDLELQIIDIDDIDIDDATDMDIQNSDGDNENMMSLISLTKGTSEESVCPKKDKGSKETILHTLFEHYRCLQVFGIRLTWLGFHMLYRVTLVVSNTYITEPVPRLLTMTSVLMVIALANTLVKPYSDNMANITASLSYAAGLCIAILSLWKTGLVTFDCKTNCSMKTTLLWYFEIFEKVLLVYLPVVAFIGWILYTVMKKCRSKPKSE